MASGALALTTAAALMAASSGGRPEEAHSDAAVSSSSSDNGTGDGKGHPDASRSTEELTAEQSRWFAAGMVKPGLREIPLAEVQQHGAKAERVWVTYKDGVYDVTDFVVAHPGGNKILLAAGGSIEPFWALYANHKTAEVMKILEGMRIGNLAQADREAARRAPKAADANDPYGREPARHPALRINMKQPFNAETPPELLTESLITPNDIFYVRFVPDRERGAGGWGFEHVCLTPTTVTIAATTCPCPLSTLPRTAWRCGGPASAACSCRSTT